MNIFFFIKSYKQLGIRVIEYDSYFIVLPTHPNFELVGKWTWATHPLWDPQMQKKNKKNSATRVVSHRQNRKDTRVFG